MLDGGELEVSWRSEFSRSRPTTVLLSQKSHAVRKQRRRRRYPRGMRTCDGRYPLSSHDNDFRADKITAAVGVSLSRIKEMNFQRLPLISSSVLL